MKNVEKILSSKHSDEFNHRAMRYVDTSEQGVRDIYNFVSETLHTVRIFQELEPFKNDKTLHIVNWAIIVEIRPGDWLIREDEEDAVSWLRDEVVQTHYNIINP